MPIRNPCVFLFYHAISQIHGVLVRISPGYPPITGRLHTCYSPVRRSPPKYCYLVLPLDLHVLGLSLAFILSQDQTLHCIFFILSFSFSMFPVFLLTWYLFLVLSPKTYSGLKKFPFPYTTSCCCISSQRSRSLLSYCPASSSRNTLDLQLETSFLLGLQSYIFFSLLPNLFQNFFGFLFLISPF